MSAICAPERRILIADDQHDLLDALRLLLKNEGIVMDAVTSPDAVVEAVKRRTYDLLLMDLNYTGDTTSGREGIDLLARVRQHDDLLPIVAMTGWGSVDLAVEAMRSGVCDFVQKPWDNRQLVSTLRAEIEKGRARRLERQTATREFSEAERIQRKLLPAVLPHVDGCELAASWKPAAGVGGDCYDAMAFTPTRVALSIADVVGKGIPAALLMSNLQAAVRAFASDTTEPAALCQQVNRILCGNIAEGRFISFVYCMVDTEQRTLTYANAGHYPPILLRRDGAVERLATGGPVLGIFGDAVYEQRQVNIEPGDRVVLFTDGITDVREAGTDENAAEYADLGEDRLAAIAREHRGCAAPDLLDRVAAAVSAFAGGEFQDDATLIVLAVL
jgi:sigma-B regulation protein RsbU (phosphoserine phosphatase)